VESLPRPVSSFPWHALPRVAAGETLAVRAVRRAHPGVRAVEVCAALRELVGHEVTIDLRRRALTSASRAEIGGRGPSTLLASESCRAVIEVEAELALALVSALAGGRSLPRVAMGRRVDPLVAGALAGVVQHVARACGEDDLAIVAIDPPLDDVRRALGTEIVSFDFLVRLGAIRASARMLVTVPERVPARLAHSKDVLRAMGDTPRTLEHVIGAGFAPVRALSDLQVGDVVLVDVRLRALAAPDARSGVGVELVAAGELRIGGATIELAPEPESVEKRKMTEPDASGATVEMPALSDESSPIADAIADMPVLVRVEAGSVTLAAREWAMLGVGDVVVLDARVGEAVTLRVGGKVVGRGDLVEVDGSIGVRIVERTS
jgi:flagellar motor switch protein FliN/FliY